MPITQDRIIEVTRAGRKLIEILRELNKHASRCEYNKDPEIDALFSLIWAVKDAQPSISIMEPILREEAHFKAREKMNISRRNWQRRKDEATNGVRRKFTEQELSEREENRVTRSMDPEVRAQMIKDQARRAEPFLPMVPSTKEESFHKEGRSLAEILADQAALNAEEEEELAALRAGSF